MWRRNSNLRWGVKRLGFFKWQTRTLEGWKGDESAEIRDADHTIALRRIVGCVRQQPFFG
jgi:hypothetical protein